jgi:threonine dehydratase
VLAPCSGGGLIGGIALAFSALSPATRVCSVEPENYDGLRRSLAAGERIAAPCGAPSLADALMAPIPGAIPFALAQRHLSEALTVRDSDMSEAVQVAAGSLKLVVEISGTAALACLISNGFNFNGDTIAVVLSGGNSDGGR